MTTREAADKLGVNIGRVCALIWSGRLKAERFGRLWDVDPRSVESFERRGPGGRPLKEMRNGNQP